MQLRLAHKSTYRRHTNWLIYDIYTTNKPINMTKLCRWIAASQSRPTYATWVSQAIPSRQNWPITLQELDLIHSTDNEQEDLQWSTSPLLTKYYLLLLEQCQTPLMTIWSYHINTYSIVKGISAFIPQLLETESFKVNALYPFISDIRNVTARIT